MLNSFSAASVLLKILKLQSKQNVLRIIILAVSVTEQQQTLLGLKISIWQMSSCLLVIIICVWAFILIR